MFFGKWAKVGRPSPHTIGLCALRPSEGSPKARAAHKTCPRSIISNRIWACHFFEIISRTRIDMSSRSSLDCASTCHFIADEGTTRTRVPDEDTPSSHVWYVCLVRYTPSHVWHVPSEDTPSHVCHFDDYRTRQGRTRQRRTINVTFACLALC